MHVVSLLSGGLDSTVLLFSLKAQGHTVLPLLVQYGQRHARELDAARHVCRAQQLAWHEADLRALAPLLVGSSQTSAEIPVPEGHYTDVSMKATVVPNRNMLMLSCAIACAVSQDARAVAYAAHAGDHPIYPDCRPAFIAAMTEAARLCAWTPVDLWAPFQLMRKADIVRLGASLGVPFAETWSCYQGGPVHCGRCGTCTERLEAFVLAGIPDPTEYAHVGAAENLCV
jgi:7-cyano-7-deazaguanine synthase